MKKLLIFLLSFVSVFAVGQRNYDGINKISQYGNDADALRFALSVQPHIFIDQNITIDDTLTIQQHQTITIYTGIVINATSKLLIAGKLNAEKTRIFADGSIVNWVQFAAVDLYPEWWGAVPMRNVRDADFSGGAIDNITYLEACSNAVSGLNYFNNENTNTTIRISGIYGVSRKWRITEKTVHIIGNSQNFDGTGFRFLGELTGEDNQNAILEYAGCNYSRLENIAFKGKRSTDTSLMQEAAISFICLPEKTPQRKITFKNVSIGNLYGHWGDQGLGYDFKSGIVAGLEGMDSNNDFFEFDNIMIANVINGIDNRLPMAVNWLIKRYAFGYGDNMITYPNGGQFIGIEWYPATDMWGWAVKGPSTQSYLLRFEIYNWDCEHLKGLGLVWANGPVRGKFSGGHINNANNNDTDGFELLGGLAAQYNPLLTFEDITFVLEDRMYFDLTPATGSKGSLRFINCQSVEGVEFKMSTGQILPATFNIIVEGRFMNSASDPYMSSNITLQNTNPLIGLGGYVGMDDLLATGNRDIQTKTLTLGMKGFSTTTKMTSAPTVMYTVADHTNMFRVQGALLKANTYIKGVTVLNLESNIVFNGADYIKVGDGVDDEKFGRIQGQNSYAQNNKSVTGGLVYTTDHNVTLKAFDGSNNPIQLQPGKLIMLIIDYETYGNDANAISYDVLQYLPFDPGPILD